jgi:serpin B
MTAKLEENGDNNMRYISLLSAVFLTAVLIGCGEAGNLEKITPNSSTLSETNITSENIDLVSNANNDFSFDIYRHFEEDGDNHFISSYSLFSMFNILLPGAKGTTKEEMLKAGNITISEEKWFNYFEELNRRVVSFLDDNNSGFQFSFANSFWVQTGIDVNSDYKNRVEKTFGMDIRTVDFENDSQVARQTINDWTSNATNNHIEEILSEESVNENSKMILVNAMHLKALWTKSFFHNDTTNSPFSLLDGSSVSVPLMHQINKFRYCL